MQEKHLFEYAVIRIVPRVEREEFLNVGVILYCPKLKYLQLIYTLDTHRLFCFYPQQGTGQAKQGPQQPQQATQPFQQGTQPFQQGTREPQPAQQTTPQPHLDIVELQQHLRAFEDITLGRKEGGPIAQLDLPGRFRWLTATRSTILQTSKVHPGFCSDPAAALQRLHATLVL